MIPQQVKDIMEGQQRIRAIAQFKERFKAVPEWKHFCQKLSFNEINVLGYILLKKKLPPTEIAGSYSNATERQRVLARIFASLDFRDLLHLINHGIFQRLSPKYNFRQVLVKTRTCLHTTHKHRACTRGVYYSGLSSGAKRVAPCFGFEEQWP